MDQPFAIGEKVRVIESASSFWDFVGTVDEVIDGGIYGVRFASALQHDYFSFVELRRAE